MKNGFKFLKGLMVAIITINSRLLNDLIISFLGIKNANLILGSSSIASKRIDNPLDYFIFFVIVITFFSILIGEYTKSKGKKLKYAFFLSYLLLVLIETAEYIFSMKNVLLNILPILLSNIIGALVMGMLIVILWPKKFVYRI